jgi:hypothetical protein
MSLILAQIINGNANATAADSGIELGAFIAVVCSWQRNRSILWAILAGILSWLYVIYFAATRRPGERKYQCAASLCARPSPAAR